MKSLYALGFDELRRYTLDGNSLVLAQTFNVPGDGAHELSPVGDGLLLCTTHDPLKFLDIWGGEVEWLEI